MPFFLAIAAMIGAAIYFHHDPTPEERRAEAQRYRDEVQASVAPLLSIDGCTVFRFSDDGRFHYFVDCRGSVIGSHTEQSGKTRTTHDEEIPTEGRGL
jgi:hypothetical protein